jgi:hypothetical protein
MSEVRLGSEHQTEKLQEDGLRFSVKSQPCCFLEGRSEWRLDVSSSREKFAI